MSANIPATTVAASATDIAKAATTPPKGPKPVFKPVFPGEAAPPLWTRILSPGHSIIARLNDAGTEDLHFLPQRTRIIGYSVAAGLIAASIIVPLDGVYGANAIHNWQAQRAQAQRQAVAQAKAEAEQRVQQELHAAQQLAAAQEAENTKRAPVVIAALFNAGLQSPDIGTIPSATVFNAETQGDLAKAFWAAIKGTSPGDIFGVFDASGKWAKTIAYRKLDDATCLMAIAVDDGGIRKVWLAVMQDQSRRGTGLPNVIHSVVTIPGVDAAHTYVVPETSTLNFNQIQGLVGRSLFTK